MMALKGKDYYLAPIYPMLYAAGGSLLGEVEGAPSAPALVACRLARRCVCAGPGCGTAGSPGSSASQDCPPHGRARHQANSDGSPDARPFAAILRGRIRWPEMVETVAGVYNSLPPEERAKTAILAHHGGAGAIDFFGPRYGLLKSISPHQNSYYWGPRQYTGVSLILLWISKMPSAGVAVWIRGQPSLRITAWSGSTMPS
jgi:hypothetical protein